MAAGATYEPIATTTLGSATNSITFSSIAASWTDLRLVLNATSFSGSGDDVLLRFNSDSGSNYSMTAVQGDGSNTASARLNNWTEIRINYREPYTDTTYPMLITTDIFSYAGSTYKTCLSAASGDYNGGGYPATSRSVALWRSTAAITNVRVFSGVNFSIGTTATLYGIKNA